MCAQLARSLNMAYYRLSPGEKGEGQFGVVPVPGADGLLHYPAPDWVGSLGEGGILLFDEINTGGPALQAPMLGAVQLGVLGSHTFSPRVRILGAANEVADAAGGWDLAVALRNRFGHLDFEGLQVAEWTDWLLGARVSDSVTVLDAVAEERRVMEMWPGAIAKASGLVAGFIRRRPDLLHKKPKKGEATRGWPSRRTWEYATVALASADVHGLSEIETDELTTGFLGAGAVVELAAWRTEADLPDPVALLDGKETFTHDVRRLDRTMAVLSSCASLCAPEKAQKRKERAGACWNLIRTVMKSTTDVVVPAARVLVTSKLVAGIPEAKPVLAEIHTVLEAAGIRAA
jgi:hypothetical protein